MGPAYHAAAMVISAIDAMATFLFIKPTTEGRNYLGDVTEASPYPGAKPCFLIAGEAWDDADWLTELIKLSAAALPMPATKKPKRNREKQVP